MPAQPRAHREPWLPVTKIVFGVGFIVLGLATIAAYVGVILVIVGTIYLVVGLAQRGQPAWRIRTLLRRAHRRPSEAPRFLTQALAVDPDNPEALAANADWEFDHQEWAKAAELFERYLAHAPQDWLAEGHAGNAWLNAGNADAAIPHLSRVRELPQLTDGGRASITAGLAMAYLRKGNAHQALDIARSEPLQRHKLEDGLQQCLFVRALAYYESGQHSHAITDLDRLASINPAYQNLNEVRNEMLTGSFQLQAIAAPPTTADSTATTP